MYEKPKNYRFLFKIWIKVIKTNRRKKTLHWQMFHDTQILDEEN